MAMFHRTRRHRRIMDESEVALAEAAESGSPLISRIVKQVLNDPKTHRLWESRHAALVQPLAEESRRVPQVLALRNMDARLLHRRALIDHIREHRIVGKRRDRLFSVFYGPKDTLDAVLTEHRQYMLAVTSRVSADHLMGVMHDSHGLHLLHLYQSVYKEYFGLYCEMVCTADPTTADMIRTAMLDAGNRANAVRAQLISSRPDDQHSSFDKEALLARSGRYPILNYMVG